MSFSCTSGRQCGANMNQQTLWNGDGQIVVATRAAAAAKISPLKPSMLRHVFDFVSERGATDEEIAAALCDARIDRPGPARGALPRRPDPRFDPSPAIVLRPVVRYLDCNR